jgi:putative PIN family toxin of toxin-antitoxin system
MSNLRVVFDTNIIVSAALLPQSIPRAALDRARSASRILISEATLAEVTDVLHRPNFNKYTTEEQRRLFLAKLILETEAVTVPAVLTDCRDPKDNKFLELAVNGAATHIVTGDADLLALHPFRGIEIVTPQAFLAEFAARNGST